MQRSYQLPFERFERYVPCGTPDDVAASLVPFLGCGCRHFNVVPEGYDLEHSIAAVAAVKTRLLRSVAVSPD
jgi:hypothetical protein